MSNSKENHTPEKKFTTEEFFKNLEKDSEEVEQWPEWKKGEYANVSYYMEEAERKKTTTGLRFFCGMSRRCRGISNGAPAGA